MIVFTADRNIIIGSNESYMVYRWNVYLDKANNC